MFEVLFDWLLEYDRLGERDLYLSRDRECDRICYLNLAVLYGEFEEDLSKRGTKDGTDIFIIFVLFYLIYLNFTYPILFYIILYYFIAMFLYLFKIK